MNPKLSNKQLIAFKIGARAHKFLLEGCPLEGYDYLFACLQEAKTTDADLYALLCKELEKYEKRIAAITDQSEP
ncbi:hypothetical protein CWRG_00071 [Chthonomonas calidirosea]|uniref:Uncharacterized protein n=1 Tax=Chthonomonas calidirosea (strain DSM 23976 / ICMP 18418 / T49) TaxID=1303518 RepID=S0EYH3_CHTCT|nr:hypothetical protein [Chthonomonas calidirosea]CCW34907.1 hypothetical protein CCALI_01085 [Chthonomonas calidirosea T49]CEK12526.1 hypothetical protein CWRG_00071 [Chthonomonas calidirosea]CEK12527.1 hypothetical protein CP488_00071 [Chthonomonas calidirosea]CEK13451.1 hypothetical protein CTKA_00074 [Chthonomonas calidirosea]